MFTSPAPRLAVFATLVATPAVLLTACTSSGSTAPASSHAPASSASHSAGAPSTRPASTHLASSHPASSSGTSSPTSTAARSTAATGTAVLVQRADAICKTGNVYRKAHPFPYDDFDSADPKVAELPGVATYLKKAPDVAGRLLALDLPLGVATALTQLRKNSTALITAAADRDPQSFAHAAADRHTVGQRLYAAAKPAGLAGATACLSYFNKV